MRSLAAAGFVGLALGAAIPSDLAAGDFKPRYRPATARVASVHMHIECRTGWWAVRAPRDAAPGVAYVPRWRTRCG